MSHNPNALSVKATTSRFPIPQYITPEQYGCKGDGIADDTAALNTFLSKAQGSIAIMVGQYKVTSLIVTPLVNCQLIGVPGQTKIFGSFGYGVIQFQLLSNAIVDGITFQTDYVNAVEDPTFSVAYSTQDNVFNSTFNNCIFSSPNANTSGLTFYTRINAGDTATIDGLWVTKCNFLNVGRIGCTIMNRGTNADKYDAAKRVYFNGNVGRNLGLSGSFGFLLSLDGYGQAFSANDNHIENALGIGIENTGWVNGQICGNTGEIFSRAWCLLSIDGTNGASPRIMTGLVISGNSTNGSASAHSNFIYVKNSYFSGNVFDVAAASDLDEAALFRVCQHNSIVADQYINRSTAAKHAMYCEHDTSNNNWTGCTYSLPGVTSSDFAIFFSDTGSVGTLTTGNRVHNPVIDVASGGQPCGQDTGVSGNICEPFVTSGNANPVNFSVITFPADANYTVQSPQDVIGYPVLQINGTLSVARTLNFLSAACFNTPKTMKNNTINTVVLSVNGSAGDSLTAGNTFTVFFDGTTLRTP